MKKLFKNKISISTWIVLGAVILRFSGSRSVADQAWLLLVVGMATDQIQNYKSRNPMLCYSMTAVLWLGFLLGFLW